MSLTVRRVAEIRDALDLFKQRNNDVKTDTGAIEIMVNRYNELIDSLDSAHTKIAKLKSEHNKLIDQQENLSRALKPFVKSLVKGGAG